MSVLAFEKFRRGHNGDMAIGTKAKQMRIAGDNSRGVGGESTGKKFVVIRVVGNYSYSFLCLHKSRPEKDKFKNVDLQGGGEFEFWVGNYPLKLGVDIPGDTVDYLPLFHQTQHSFRFAVPTEG